MLDRARDPPAMSFIHLRACSDHSLLDSACTIPELVRAAAGDGQPGIALTDSGTMSGIPALFRECAEQDMQAIAGCEVSVIGSAPGLGAAKADLAQISLLAAGADGYRSLCAISSAGYMGEDKKVRPHVDLEELAGNANGIIALTGGRYSGICSSAATGDRRDARDRIQRLVEALGGDNVYVELVLDGTPEQDQRNTVLTGLADSLGLRVVATADIHYLADRDRATWIALRATARDQTLRSADEDIGPGRFSWRSTREMEEAFACQPEALAATLEIADRCRMRLEPCGLLPRALPTVVDADTDLRNRVLAGLAERYNDVAVAAARERAEYELSVIVGGGLASYFLIVADMLAFARAENIEHGPGRGSAPGSVACFALGITDVDPLANGLLFERFLDPDRAGWDGQRPDIDVDVSVSGRERVACHLYERFGEDRVAGVATYGRLFARGAVRSAGSALEHPPARTDQLARLIPDPVIGRPPSLASCLEDGEPLATAVHADAASRLVVDLAAGLEGRQRNVGRHAAAYVIGDGPLTHRLPLRRLAGAAPGMVTQYSMREVEQLGLLKLDLVGLNELTIVEDALGLIEAHTGERPDLRRIPLDDPEAYALGGRTRPVYPFGSDRARDALKAIKPDCLDDLAAVVVMNGTRTAHLISEYALRKAGEAITTAPAALTEALADTHGLLLYQEQLMMAAMSVGGFTGSQANGLRRALGEKQQEAISTCERQFIDGCARRGINREDAQAAFDLMRASADWAFNRSHALSYALIAYRCLWLIAHHPAEYLAAALRHDLSRSPDARSRGDHVSALYRLRYVAHRDVEIAGAHVNVPVMLADATPGRIELGLGVVCGLTHAEQVVAARTERGPFADVDDLRRRVPLTDAELDVLGTAGALDGLSTRATPHSQRVLAMVDMNAVVAEHAAVRPVGPEHSVGGGPFHEEHGHSLMVWPTEKRWHCYGCGEGGDAFDLVMKAEGVDFDEAVRRLDR